MRELESYLSRAYSFESRETHGAGNRNTTAIGSIQYGNRIYDLYQDTAGNYWYKTRIIKDGQALPEYEAIFGHPEREKYENNRHHVTKRRDR